MNLINYIKELFTPTARCSVCQIKRKKEVFLEVSTPRSTYYICHTKPPFASECEMKKLLQEQQLAEEYWNAKD